MQPQWLCPGRRWRYYQKIIVAIVAGVHLGRGQQRLKVDDKAPAQVTAEGQLQVKIGLGDHVGDRIMETLHLRLIFSLMLLPYLMQPGCLIEVPE